MIYFWTLKYMQDIVHYEMGISAPTVIDFYNFWVKFKVVDTIRVMLVLALVLWSWVLSHG